MLEPKDKDFIKNLEEIKDNKTKIEIRVFDYKNMRLAYKTLTVREVILLSAGIELDWQELKKEDKE